MGESRIDQALGRIAAAMARIEAVDAPSSFNQNNPPPSEENGAQRIMALVNTHEKLREEVAEVMSEIDHLIEEHE